MAKAKAKRLKRSRGPSDDGMSPEETASPTRCSEGRRNTGRKKGAHACSAPCDVTASRPLHNINESSSTLYLADGGSAAQQLATASWNHLPTASCNLATGPGDLAAAFWRDTRRKTRGKKGKMIQILVKLMDETSETRKLLENHIESNNNQNIMFGKYLEKLTESLEKLSESHNDPRKQLELHTNAPRSLWNQEQPPRYKLIFRSEVTGKIEKGKTIEIHVALVDVNNGQTVKNGPLASATVELVVIDAKFNENDNQYSWSREDFVSNIKKAPQGNSATVNVDQSVKSIVSNGRFNLENGDKRHCDFTIFSNSGNKKVRLGVMVVSPTQERVLEGLSNPFFVRGHDRPNRRQARVDNGNPEQNGPMSNMQNPSCPNSTQADGNGSVITPVLGGQYQPLFQRNTPVLYTEPATIKQHQVPHRSMLAQASNSQTVQVSVDNGNQEQNDPMSNMQNHSCPNSTQADGNGSFITPMHGGQHQPLFQRNTPVLSTEPATSQQHQVLHWSMLAQASNNRTVQAWVDNGNQEQNGPMSNMQNPSCPNSTQADGNGSVITPMFGGQHQPLVERNTPVLPTEPATSQQHQVPHWSMLAQASNNPTGLNAIGQTRPQFTGNADIACTEPSASQVQQAWIPQNQDHWPNLTHQPMNNGTGTPFYTNQRAFPVRLEWDMPSVVPSKHCFNLLDQLMQLHSWQPKFKNCNLPTRCLMQERFGSLTTMPKEVLQTHRGRGVLIEPLEPDDSDEGRPLKRNLHSKYQLRFVNKVCETYYTWDQIKADEGNLLKVALFDENNTKITSGPLSSASVEIVALHGDFNGNGQDYWTSEEFNRSVVCLCPPPGEEASSVLGGDRILVLAGGEACLGDAFFQKTSFCARTGKFKMGVMLASVQDERVQEGISEPFRVMDNRVKELHAKNGPTQGFNPAAATLQFPRNTVTEAIEGSRWRIAEGARLGTAPLAYLQWHLRTWRVVSEEDSHHVNGVLGALVRHYFPGIVTHAGKDEPAYTWAHYESAHHATAGNVAAHILQKLCTYFKLDESYKDNADAVAARKACRKRVTDMYHKARVQAIRGYYMKQFGQSVNKKQIRDRRLSLTKEQFMQVIPWWCVKSPEAWGQIVDRWLSEEWWQQHAAARAHRLAMPVVLHHQGNRNVGGFGRAWSAAHDGQPCSYFAAYTMSHKGKATSDVSFNPEDPPEAYTSESAYKKVTEYHETARAMYGPDYDPTTDNIDARLVMCLGKGKQHGRYWMANSVIDSATTPTLSKIRAQTTSGSGLPPIREQPAYGQAQVEALQAQVETSNKRADELEAVVASERAARLASDQGMSDVLAFLQSSLGVTLSPSLMGPPQPPPIVPPFIALNTTPPQLAGSNHVPNEHGGPSPPSHGWPGYQPPPSLQ